MHVIALRNITLIQRPHGANITIKLDVNVAVAIIAVQSDLHLCTLLIESIVFLIAVVSIRRLLRASHESTNILTSGRF